jgi:hypothetical protein
MRINVNHPLECASDPEPMEYGALGALRTPEGISAEQGFPGSNQTIPIDIVWQIDSRHLLKPLNLFINRVQALEFAVQIFKLHKGSSLVGVHQEYSMALVHNLPRSWQSIGPSRPSVHGALPHP